MVAKGAWLRAPVIIRQGHQTNDADVRKAKAEAIGKAMLEDLRRNYPERGLYLRALREI